MYKSTIVAGPVNEGKTFYLINLSIEHANIGKKVLFVNTELSTENVTTIFLAYGTISDNITIVNTKVGDYDGFVNAFNAGDYNDVIIDSPTLLNPHENQFTLYKNIIDIVNVSADITFSMQLNRIVAYSDITEISESIKDPIYDIVNYVHLLKKEDDIYVQHILKYDETEQEPIGNMWYLERNDQGYPKFCKFGE